MSPTDLTLTDDDIPFSEAAPVLYAKRQAWLNLNLFSIKLSQLGIPEFDDTKRGLGVLRLTLEEAPWEQYNYPEIDEREDEDDPDDEDFLEWKAKELETKDVRTLNGYAPAAAAWIKQLGKVIYEKEGPTGEYDWIKTKWTGDKVWSKARFHFWRERFEWIASVTALDRKTRNEALSVAELMKKIEEPSV
jgi:Protein of unknown function (DUF3632)